MDDDAWYTAAVVMLSVVLASIVVDAMFYFLH